MAFNRSLVQKWYAPGRLFIRLVKPNSSYFKLNAFSCTGLFSLTDLTISPLLIYLIYNSRQTKTNLSSQSARKMHCIFLLIMSASRVILLYLRFYRRIFSGSLGSRTSWKISDRIWTVAEVASCVSLYLKVT